MNFRDFWYVAADARKLRVGEVVSTKILGEWIALFRDDTGRAVALQDRCLHRCAQLSKGRVDQGNLRCSYHGWAYDGGGHVVSVPSEGPQKPKSARRSIPFATLERDDYIYVRLNPESDFGLEPFPVPYYRQKGWKAIRLENHFLNNVTNCAENFVDIPHTLFVHPKIFRWQGQNEKLTATVRRESGSVLVDYRGEKANLGIFSWFLNPEKKEILHRDHFHMPNVTSVEYGFGNGRRFFITSQSVPLTEHETLVYTDLTYDYGIWNNLAAPIIKRQAQRIIDQDIDILGNQMHAIRKYGDEFANTEADVIHLMVESIRNDLEQGNDPRKLPDRHHDIEFWV